MEDNIAIKADNLSKVYKIFDKPFDRVKESLHPFGKRYSKDFYAVRDVSFAIEKGDTIGIIGHNGAGKSTLLKIITGVLTPSGGTLAVNGRIASLLELGAGFNPEMTGMENIYMNGALMGYSKEEMDRRVDDIVAFADIGDFINQPVKMYSSGMFARLAFAVNVFVEPDILIVDEALAVGDVFFQNKCFKKFQELHDRGITILFVSHDIVSIKQMCSKVLWLKAGQAKEFGEAAAVCESYFAEQLEKNNELYKNSGIINTNDNQEIKKGRGNSVFTLIPSKENDVLHGDVVIKSFFFLDEKNTTVNILKEEEIYRAVLVVHFLRGMNHIIFGFSCENNKGVSLFGINSYHENSGKNVEIPDEGIFEVVFTFQLPKIMQGEYLISPAVAQGIQTEYVVLTWLQNALAVTIEKKEQSAFLIEIDSSIEICEHDKEAVKFM